MGLATHGRNDAPDHCSNAACDRGSTIADTLSNGQPGVARLAKPTIPRILARWDGAPHSSSERKRHLAGGRLQVKRITIDPMVRLIVPPRHRRHIGL